LNRYKYLLKNIGLLTLSNFATKLLSFFLVPLYTNVLTTAEYGTYDLFNTTIGVLLPILTLNIQDAVMRFSMDARYSKKAIVTVATKYLLISNLLVSGILVCNYVIDFSAVVKQFSFYFFLMFLAQSLSGIITMYARGIDKISDLSVSSVISSAITIFLNIIFLIVFHFGLPGYFLANIIGPIFQCLYLIIKAHVIHDIEWDGNFSNEEKILTKYSVPLISNSIAWWVNNASDRYIVVFFCGLAENGIYSVATKIPSILNIFQVIFNQAWSLSAVRDFDPNDRDGFFANTYRAYNCGMVILCSIIISFDKFLAKFLYAKDFYIAWKYVPWLTIAILFGAISGYIGGFFTAVKDSKVFAKSTIYGAVTNIVLNLILTPIIGVLGASVATAISYFEVWALRYWYSKRYIRIKINLARDLISYAFLVIQASALLLESIDKSIFICETFISVVIVILYWNDIIAIFGKFKDSVHRKAIKK
jgi:O-antigen/teichoic acid export membrane protein